MPPKKRKAPDVNRAGQPIKKIKLSRTTSAQLHAPEPAGEETSTPTQKPFGLKITIRGDGGGGKPKPEPLQIQDNDAEPTGTDEVSAPAGKDDDTDTVDDGGESDHDDDPPREDSPEAKCEDASGGDSRPPRHLCQLCLRDGKRVRVDSDDTRLQALHVHHSHPEKFQDWVANLPLEAGVEAVEVAWSVRLDKAIKTLTTLSKQPHPSIDWSNVDDVARAERAIWLVEQAVQSIS